MKNLKTFIALATIVFLMEARGQSYPHPNDPRLVQSVITKIHRIEINLQRMRGKISSMDSYQLMNVDEDLMQVLSILRGNQPRPNPQNHTISGTLEKHGFLYEIADVADFGRQCFEQFKSVGKTDEATYSLNFSPSTPVRTSSWWESGGVACAVIADKLAKQGVPGKISSGLSVTGGFDTLSFHFEGYTAFDVMKQCVDFVNDNKMTKADEIVAIGNGNKFIDQKNSGWWEGATAICNVAMQTLR